MEIDHKTNEAYKTIGEVTKEIGLIDSKTGNLQTHTLRYWETQFRQIKPSIKAGNRRYYSKKNIQIIKLIKFLLKDKGLTIKGVKKVLSSSDVRSIDDASNLSLYNKKIKDNKNLKIKLKKIINIIKDIKSIK